MVEEEGPGSFVSFKTGEVPCLLLQRQQGRGKLRSNHVDERIGREQCDLFVALELDRATARREVLVYIVYLDTSASPCLPRLNRVVGSGRSAMLEELESEGGRAYPERVVATCPLLSVHD